MAWQLAIVEIDGKKYYDDTRLREYRNVERFTDAIPYSEIGSRKVKLLQERTDLLEKKRVRQRPGGKRL
jgi:hypothetical protein